MAKIVEIRNSTAEFLIFVAANKEDGVQEAATTEKISVVQLEGSRNVNREPTFNNLDAIISVGYTNTSRNMPKRSSNATASSRTASSAATSRKCSWMVESCQSCRWKGCQREESTASS